MLASRRVCGVRGRPGMDGRCVGVAGGEPQLGALRVTGISKPEYRSSQKRSPWVAMVVVQEAHRHPASGHRAL